MQIQQPHETQQQGHARHDDGDVDQHTRAAQQQFRWKMKLSSTINPAMPVMMAGAVLVKIRLTSPSHLTTARR